MPSNISSTPPPGGSRSLDVSSATPSTVIDLTSRLRLDDSLDSSVPYSPGCPLGDSSFNETGALADSSAMSASPRGGAGDGRSSLSSPSSSLASDRRGGGSNGSGQNGGRGGGNSTTFEKPVCTKIFYHIDDESMPYMTQVDVPPEHVTLEDFKKVLTRTNFKYYCKVYDADVGEVKKELLEDHKPLERSANGNFELFLITIEGSTHSEGSSQQGRASGRHHNMMVPGPAPSYNNMYMRGAVGGGNGHYFDSTMSTESDSMISDGRPPFLPGRNQLQASTRYGNRGGPPPVRHNHHYDFNGHRGRGLGGGRYDDSTLGSESDARVFSDEDDRGSMSTDLTSVSRQHEKMMARKRRAQRTYHRRPSRASSFSSITESSMSLHVETVTLNMDTVNFLGISIVGQSSARGDNGIYVANVMKGGAVALDGRIEQGDMILQVNEVEFANFTNDQAVDVLREAVERKGTIRLTVAKSIDSNQRSCFTVPRHQPAAYNTRDEPVRPIDTGAWIQHTNAMRGAMPSILEGSEGAPTPLPGERMHHHQLQQQRPATSSSATSTGSNGQNTVVGGSGGSGQLPRLDVHGDKRKVVEVMTRPGSGLDIKNRTWLKISIPMSFLGSDLVDWLLEHVSGLRERKEARKYAAELLRQRLIAHVVNKITFTEQCYYVLGEQCADFARYRSMQGEDGGVAPSWQWGGQVQGGQPKPPGVLPPGHGGSMVSGYASMPMSPMFGAAPAPGWRQVVGGEGSQVSSTDGSGSSDAQKRSARPVVLPPPPTAAAAAGSTGRLNEIPHDVAASRQSFRIAMNNPYEFFVDNL